MIRAAAFVAIFSALVFVQFIGAVFQPSAGRAAQASGAEPPSATTVEFDQRAMEDLAAWPAATGR